MDPLVRADPEPRIFAGFFKHIRPDVPLQTFWQAGCEGMIGVWSGGEAMGRPSTIPAEKKIRIVLAILAGEMSIAEAARKEKVSEQSIGRWKAEFIDAGRTALVAGRSGPSSREEQLESEVVELTQALVRRMSSCWSGRRARRAGWALRGPRGNPHRGGDVDREVLPARRHR